METLALNKKRDYGETMSLHTHCFRRFGYYPNSPFTAGSPGPAARV